MGMALGLLTLAVGFVLGRLSVRRYRRDRIAWAQRRLQLQVLSLELKSLHCTVSTPLKRAACSASRWALSCSRVMRTCLANVHAMP